MKPVFENERQFFFKHSGILLPEDCWRNGTKIYLDCTCCTPLYLFNVENKKIRIIKDNTKLFTAYKQKSIVELILQFDEKLNQLQNRSVCKTVEYIISKPNDKFIVSHSSGKDSTVQYDIWLQAIQILKEKHSEILENLKWEIVFENTSNDTPDTYKYIKSELPKEKLKILNPQQGFYQWIVKTKNYFIPSTLVRNCCSTFKEGQLNKHYNKSENITFVSGVRKYESTKRAEYDYIMDEAFRKRLYGKSIQPENWTTFAPIVEWKDEEIWLYILRERLKYNNQYNYGFNRCGCLVCPYQSDYTDLLIEEYYTSIWKRWTEILKQNYSIWHIKDNLKWNLEEWINGRWKRGISKEYELINHSPTKERIKRLAEIKGISETMAKKYFKKKCICGKRLNPTEIGMFYKEYGRFEDIDDDKRQILCKACFCKKEKISGKEYTQKAISYRDGGCNLF